MRCQSVRALLVEADVREIERVRRAFMSAATHRTAIRWQIEPVKTIAAALAQLRRQETDVIVVGLCSKGKAGRQPLLCLRQASPGAPIIFLAEAKDEKLLATVAALGAWEVLARRQAGPSAPNPARVATGCSSAWGAEIARLTPREMQILELIANNMSTKEVAGHLNLAVKTAETHRTNLMRKLEIHSVSQLVRLAVRHKIVEV